VKRVMLYPAYTIPIVFLLVMVALASYNAPDSFHWTSDPLTWLGGQYLEKGWMMNWGWIGFGVMIIMITVGYHYREDWSSAITYPLIAFGMSVIFMGIWKSSHPYSSMVMDLEEAYEHMIFSMIAIGSIFMGMLVHFVLSRDKKTKSIHGLLMGLIACDVVLSMSINSMQGLLDRVMWIMICAWLILCMGKVQSDGYNR